MGAVFAALTPGTGASLGERVSDTILYRSGVFITPGFIFGENGKDYVRISLCAKPEVLVHAKCLIESILNNNPS